MLGHPLKKNNYDFDIVCDLLLPYKLPLDLLCINLRLIPIEIKYYNFACSVLVIIILIFPLKHNFNSNKKYR